MPKTAVLSQKSATLFERCNKTFACYAIHRSCIFQSYVFQSRIFRSRIFRSCILITTFRSCIFRSLIFRSCIFNHAFSSTAIWSYIFLHLWPAFSGPAFSAPPFVYCCCYDYHFECYYVRWNKTVDTMQTRWLYCVECPQYSTRRRSAFNIHRSSMLRKNR